MWGGVSIAIMRARVIFCLLTLWALALPGVAQVRGGAPSLDRVLPQIRRATPGTLYDAQGPFIGPNGQASYRLKWMTPEGRIVWFYVDARTGRMLGAGPAGLPPPDRFGGPYGYGQGGYPSGGSHFEQNHGNWNGGGWGERGGHGGDWKGNGRGGDSRQGHHGG